MKLHIGLPGDTPLFTAYGDDYVVVGSQRHENNIAIFQGKVHPDWTSNNFDNLQEADFALIAASGIEIALLGTGSRLRFPPPALLRPLAGTRVGLEVMDTLAACRTYNILIAEDRKVGVFLLLE